MSPADEAAQKAAHARALLADPVLIEILSSLEQSAIDATINAGPTDHQKRADYAAEARAIRRVRDRLNDFVKQETWQARKVA